jgi:two-component system nitrogen regulation response regulator GlnG
MSESIWIVDDDQSILWVMDKALSKQGYAVKTFTHCGVLLDALEQGAPNLVISDIPMPEMDGFSLLEQINQQHQGLPVIIMTAYGDLDSAVDSFKYGAYEYLTKPFDIDEMLAIVARCIDEQQLQKAENANSRPVTDRQLLGESPAMQEVFRVIGRIARSSMGILIRGESGTGKELIANAIYSSSSRSEFPLVAINTAAIPAELLESELFGHEKGAFTGAHSRHIGRFEQANGATLFLDEIGDMPLALQTRLLRVLSEGRFYRVGGREEIAVDVRIIAATNQDLEQLVEQRKFRNDLFHRLNVLSLSVPPLRQRKEDIPILVKQFLDRAAIQNEIPVKQLGSGVLPALQQYNWPGNIRELENMIQQLSILSVGNRIEHSDLPDSLVASVPIESSDSWQRQLAGEVSHKLRLGEKALARTLGREFEQVLIGAALEHTRGHKQQAAELLGWGRNTLTRKMGRR